MSYVSGSAPTGQAFNDYNVTSSDQSGGAGGDSGEAKSAYWGLDRLKRSYLDYLGSKIQEYEEQKDSRRYRHGTQWTSAQIKALNKRKQPVVTYNRIGPKINGVIGLIEKLRQAPKGYPRTPKDQEGADLASAVLRFALDENQWKSKSPICAEDGAVDGIGGVEVIVEPGDEGDPDIGFEVVEPDSFFYDPRSYRLDFSDCRFLGQGKWLDLDAAIEMFPDQADTLRDSVEGGTDLTTNPDREQKWFISDGDIKRVRIVDAWYKSQSEWRYCVFAGMSKLAEGDSFLVDEKGKTMCKYVMFSANIDQDGDRYGFVRQFRSAQDEVNQRRSKALHTLNTRRIIGEIGAFDDIERTRVEAMRPDGVVLRNKGFEAEFDDAARLQETNAQLQFLQEAKNELDGYGPTLSLIGEQQQEISGRALAMQQAAGIAQLGPFMLSYKNWKIRLYRVLWNAIRQYWTAERWIRVTDDPQSVGFVGINQVGINPQTGMPAMINQVATLDVDIIMDEGPDSMNLMADTYDALIAIAQNGAQVPPDVLLELAPGIDANTRQRLIQRLKQPDPQAAQKSQLEMAMATAKVQDTQADAKLKQIQAVETAQKLTQPQSNVSIEQPDNPATVQAEINQTNAKAMLHKAQALKTLNETFNPQAQAPASAQASVPGHSPAPDPVAQKAALDTRDKQIGWKERAARLAMDHDKAQHDKSLKEREFMLKVKAHNKQVMDEGQAQEPAKPTEAELLGKRIEALHGVLKDTMGQLSSHQKELAAALTAPRKTKVVRDSKTGRVDHTLSTVEQ